MSLLNQDHSENSQTAPKHMERLTERSAPLVQGYVHETDTSLYSMYGLLRHILDQQPDASLQPVKDIEQQPTDIWGNMNSQPGVMNHQAETPVQMVGDVQQPADKWNAIGAQVGVQAVEQTRMERQLTPQMADKDEPDLAPIYQLIDKAYQNGTLAQEQQNA